MTTRRFVAHLAVAAALTTAGLTPAAAAQAAAPAPQEISGQTLLSANTARAKYGASPLSWSEALYPSAVSWGAKCKFASSPSGGKYGENLFATTGTPTNKAAIIAAFKVWMEGAAKYDYAKPGFSVATGAFTQVVWKGSTQIAVSVRKCAAGTIFAVPSTFVVARFSPPGNYIGRFRQNVGRPVA